MKTVVSTPDGVGVEERPDPHAPAGGVVLAVHSCGVCGSDLHFVTEPGRRVGQVLGHELSGTVVEVGADVHGIDVGERFAVNPLGSCGHCAACRAGLPLRCEVVPNLGLNAPGGFAQYVAAPAGQLVAIPEGVDTELGAHVEPLSVAIGAIDLAPSPEGKDALVFGVGAIGLNVVMALKARGARTVVAVGRSAGRRAAAASVGADAVVDAREQTIAAYCAEHDLAFDLAYECSGARDAILDIAPTMKLRGVIVEVALSFAPTPVDLMRFVSNDLHLVGSCAFDATQFAAAADLLWSGAIDPNPLVSERVSIDDAPDAFVRLAHPDDLVGLLVQPWR